jgi:predicted component of type VI protein secretion system
MDHSEWKSACLKASKSPDFITEFVNICITLEESLESEIKDIETELKACDFDRSNIDPNKLAKSVELMKKLFNARRFLNEVSVESVEAQRRAPRDDL